MNELKRLEYVTAHYAHLQGKRLLPLALPFFVSAAWRSGWLDWWPSATSPNAGWWFVLLLAISVGASYRIEQVYRAQFGDVQPLPYYSGATTLVLSFVAFLLFAWAQNQFAWRVSVPVLFVGAMLFRLGLAAGAMRKHYLVLACCTTALALSPLTAMSPGALGITRDLMIGVGLLVAGIGDDYVLRRVLRTPTTHVSTV